MDTAPENKDIAQRAVAADRALESSELFSMPNARFQDV
jgi:hypothetical protein